MFDAVLGGVIARRRRRRGNLRQKSLAASFGDRRVTAFLAMTQTGRSARGFSVIKPELPRADAIRPPLMFDAVLGGVIAKPRSGAGVLWTPLPEQQAPTEPAGETGTEQSEADEGGYHSFMSAAAERGDWPIRCRPRRNTAPLRRFPYGATRSLPCFLSDYTKNDCAIWSKSTKPREQTAGDL